eukprot:335298-Chlamydomonas_euryale.AAC.4
MGTWHRAMTKNGSMLCRRNNLACRADVHLIGAHCGCTGFPCQPFSPPHPHPSLLPRREVEGNQPGTVRSAVECSVAELAFTTHQYDVFRPQLLAPANPCHSRPPGKYKPVRAA